MKIIRNDFSFKKEKTFFQKLFVIYYVILVEMFNDFKSRLLFEYIKNKQWNKILEVIQKTAEKTTSDQFEKTFLQNFIIAKKVSSQQIVDFHFENLVDSRLNIRFKLRDGLIYYTNFNDDRKKLCIFNALKREIFELTYNRQHYEEFHKIYDRVVNFIYIKHLSKHLRAYINHCSKCDLN